MILIIPSIVLASWWNPFSWKIFKKSAETRVEQTVTIPPNSMDISSKTIIKEQSKTDQSAEIEKIKKEVEYLKKKTNKNTTITQPVKVSKETTPISIKENTQITPIIKEKENIDLKIEKCKAIKENTYNNTILKINQGVNSRLEEVFNSINKQTEDAAKKINDNKNAKISSYSGDNYMFYLSYYTNVASNQLDNLYKNQQAFWYTQKREIENTKQKGIDQINLLLSEEYNKCLATN